MLENFFKKGKILKNVLQKFHYLQKKPRKIMHKSKKIPKYTQNMQDMR